MQRANTLKIMGLPSTQHAATRQKGILLEDLTWQEAETYLRRETVVVIPIGAASKEHGPHLKLKNDWLLAEYFKAETKIISGVASAMNLSWSRRAIFRGTHGGRCPRRQLPIHS